ncbi:MAG: glycerol-3-phosphate ABC transporter ATP-binding protein [candidate division Zixibacteria bacterium 4484_93]|nr:MAG: glycerol-3-phosphate ABC transporter ATP-binding protein [candidate division Zixibacteria bacterium 4484_93]
MAEVILKGVSKVYEGNVHAIKDISLEIADREFLVLVGPSGCGKSTLLRMIAGLEDITSGEIQIDGHTVNQLPPKDRDISMVFQNYALYPHMTVYDNMAFGLRIRHFPKDEIDNRVQEASRILGIEKLLSRKPKALSGGQRQRVALGRAIVRKPKVFLFDEPLSNLDAKLRVHMRTEIKKLHQRLKTTMIYVTHDQVEAMTMGDRIAVVKDGILQQHDTPMNLYNNPVNIFVAGFIGSPAMNFLEGKIEDKKVVFGGISMDIPPGVRTDGISDVIVGIRPEYFILNDVSPHFTAQIEVVEPMGNEIFVYFQLGKKSVVARIPADTKVRPGDALPLRINVGMVKLFDPESKVSLSC